MSAKSVINYDTWYGWMLSEAIIAGWQVQAPYGHRRNMSGCPDLTLARGGVVLFVFLRTVSDPGLTKAQRVWSTALPEGTWHVFVPTPEDAARARELIN